MSDVKVVSERATISDYISVAAASSREAREGFSDLAAIVNNLAAAGRALPFGLFANISMSLLDGHKGFR